MDLHRRSGAVAAKDAEVIGLARGAPEDLVAALPGCPVPKSSTVAAILAYALVEAGATDLARTWLDRISVPMPNCSASTFAVPCNLYSHRVHT